MEYGYLQEEVGCIGNVHFKHSSTRRRNFISFSDAGRHTLTEGLPQSDFVPISRGHFKNVPAFSNVYFNLDLKLLQDSFKDHTNQLTQRDKHTLLLGQPLDL